MQGLLKYGEVSLRQADEPLNESVSLLNPLSRRTWRNKPKATAEIYKRFVNRSIAPVPGKSLEGLAELTRRVPMEALFDKCRFSNDNTDRRVSLNRRCDLKLRRI